MSQSVQWYMDITGKIFEGIGSRTNSKIGKFIEETEGMENLFLGFLQIGYAFSPDPLTPESFIERGPYTNPRTYEIKMDEAVEKGWLEKVGQGKYKISEQGLETVQRFLKLGNQVFSELPALSEAETSRIADLLAKLVEKAYNLPEPASKPSMEIGIRLNPGSDAPPILRVRRHLTDLNYYREDVHIAAWKPFYDVDGRVFETLTNLWQGEAATPTELAEQVSAYRHYDEADYKAAFEALVTRGWAAREDGKYILTEAGEKTRQKAEDRTDEYFAKPFTILSEAQVEELKDLLEKLAEVVKPLEEEAESVE